MIGQPPGAVCGRDLFDDAILHQAFDAVGQDVGRNAFGRGGEVPEPAGKVSEMTNGILGPSGRSFRECADGTGPFPAPANHPIMEKMFYKSKRGQRRMGKVIRACFKNISGGLAAGWSGWRRCSSVEYPRGIFSYVAPRLAQKSATQSLPSQLNRPG